jgi:hypothetical protein
VDGGFQAGQASLVVGSEVAPVLTARRAGGGNLMVYNFRTFNDAEYAEAKELLLPPLRRGLSELPREAAELFRAPLVEPLGVKFSAPAGVSLFLFGKSFVVYNFRASEQEYVLNGARRRVAANSWTWLP